MCGARIWLWWSYVNRDSNLVHWATPCVHPCRVLKITDLHDKIRHSFENIIFQLERSIRWQKTSNIDWSIMSSNVSLFKESAGRGKMIWGNSAETDSSSWTPHKVFTAPPIPTQPDCRLLKKALTTTSTNIQQQLAPLTLFVYPVFALDIYLVDGTRICIWTMVKTDVKIAVKIQSS